MLIVSHLSAEVNSASGFYLISCVQTIGRIECSEPADPFVFRVLQSLTLTTSTGNSTPMTSICQLLL